MAADRLPDLREQVAVLIRRMMALPNDPGSRRDMKAAGREALALLAGTAPVSAAVSPAEPPASVYAEIAAERVRQDAKWGGVPGIYRRDDHTYAAVLGEEFGEVCKAWLERDMDGLREELVETAAVAIAWIEEIDNRESAAWLVRLEQDTTRPAPSVERREPRTARTSATRDRS